MILKYSAFKSFRLFDEQNSYFDGNKIIFFFKKNCKPCSLSIFLHQSHVHSDLNSKNCFFFLNQILEVHTYFYVKPTCSIQYCILSTSVSRKIFRALCICIEMSSTYKNGFLLQNHQMRMWRKILGTTVKNL